MVAAHQHGHGLAVGQVDERFNQSRRLGLEKFANLLDGMRARRVEFGKVLEDCGINRLRRRDADLGFFRVRGVTANFAVNDFVLAVLGQNHKFMRRIATDGTGLRLDGQKRQAAARENLTVCLVHFVVRFVQRFQRCVKAIGVFHNEFAGPQHAEAWPLLVAEFRLDLIQRDWKLTITGNEPGHEVRNHLLMRRAEHDGHSGHAWTTPLPNSL